MIGTYFTPEECLLLFPLVIRKMDFLENLPLIDVESEKIRQLREISNYREILGKLLSSLEVGEFKNYEFKKY